MASNYNLIEEGILNQFLLYSMSKNTAVFKLNDFYNDFKSNLQNLSKETLLSSIRRSKFLFKTIDLADETVIEINTKVIWCFKIIEISNHKKLSLFVKPMLCNNYNRKGCDIKGCKFFHVCAGLFTRVKKCDHTCDKLDHTFNSPFNQNQLKFKQMENIDINQLISYYKVRASNK